MQDLKPRTLIAPVLGTPASGNLANCTFPASVLTTSALVTVGQGGTGIGTLTGVLVGNGTSAFTAVTIPSDATKYLDGTGAFSVPAGGSGLTVGMALASHTVLS